MFIGVEHAAIAAIDSRNLAKWYRDIFSFRTVYDSKIEPPTYLIKAPDGTMLEIMPADSGEAAEYNVRQAGLRHLAFTVSDFDEAKSFLENKGIVLFDYRVVDGSKLVSFRDPEGTILHLMWRPQPLD